MLKQCCIDIQFTYLLWLQHILDTTCVCTKFFLLWSMETALNWVACIMIAADICLTFELPVTLSYHKLCPECWSLYKAKCYISLVIRTALGVHAQTGMWAMERVDSCVWPWPSSWAAVVCIDFCALCFLLPDTAECSTTSLGILGTDASQPATTHQYWLPSLCSNSNHAIDTQIKEVMFNYTKMWWHGVK